MSGARFFLTVVDDYSRGVWVYLMKYKSQAVSLLTIIFAYVKNHFGVTVKAVRSDNGLEFVGSQCQNLFKEHGILHHRTCIYTPQQNGVVERKHRHLIQVARALLFQVGLSQKFWGESVLAAAYLINRLPTSVLKWQTPYEILHNKKPSYELLKVFGCLCYSTVVSPSKSKFDARSRKCLFIGYVAGCKGYKLYDLETHSILISRDVVFYESHFPLKNVSDSSDMPLPLPVFDDIDLPQSVCVQEENIELPDVQPIISTKHPSISEIPTDTTTCHPENSDVIAVKKSSRARNNHLGSRTMLLVQYPLLPILQVIILMLLPLVFLMII